MIKLDEALHIILEQHVKVETETIDFLESLGRVLAEDVKSDMEMPPFDKTAVDGFACRSQDLNETLDVIEIIPAGKVPQKKIGPNQCAKIMTGAKIPEGADTVIMVEDVQEKGTQVKFLKDKTKNNICFQGEDVKVGAVVLNKGVLIEPQHIAVMASVGYTKVLVYKQPKIGIISTGDELVEPVSKPGLGQIRNSNGYQLIAQVKKAGAIANYMGIAEDSEEATFKTISKALDENDIVLLTGGVSMGDFDFVPRVMRDCGVDIKFQKMAVQPGKPTTFGVHANAFIFGLPGNPVSSFMQFELVVKPLIYKMMGTAYKPISIRLPMGREFNRKRAERMAWFPVKITDDAKVVPVEYHGSAHIYALHTADAIVPIHIGEKQIKEGELVDVRQI